MHVIKHDAKSGEPAKYHVHVVLGERSYLHSDGQVLSTPEYWPTRADAEMILAKYPDAAPPVVEPPHEYVHGDVFEAKLTTRIMVYLVVNKKPMAFVINSNFIAGPACHLRHCLEDAKFLFNINDVVSDVYEERQAAIDAGSSDRATQTKQEPIDPPRPTGGIHEVA